MANLGLLPSFEEQLIELGEFWEKITFPNGVAVGPGRSKYVLWRDYIGSYFNPEFFRDKSILDIGCNAGGNLIELAKFGPKRLVGVDYSGRYCKQAEFVCDQFGVDAQIRQFTFDGKKTPSQLRDELGSFDVIFCLGVIYHQKFAAVSNMLHYIKQNACFAYFSQQTHDVGNNRISIDWDISKKGTAQLFERHGFSGLRDIYVKKESENWQALTNDWYFEARI